MKKVLNLALALAVVTGGLGVLTSQPAEAKGLRHVDQREYKQQKRIYAGMKNGELTRKEAKRLENKEHKLAKQEFRFRRSGNGLNKREATRLQHEQNRLSKNIYHQKHDGQNR